MSNICLVINQLTTGGAELNLLSLLQTGLAKQKVTIVTFLSGGNLVEPVRQTGVRVIELDYAQMSRIVFLRTIFKVFNSLKPDIIHAILTGPCSYALLYKMIHTKTRVILNIRGSFSTMDPRRRFIDARFWTFADCILVPCDYAKREILQELPGCSPHKIKVIHNGVCIEKFAAKIGKKNQGEKITFGVIARLDPLKGHAILIDAFRKVFHAWPETRLLVVGDGPQRADLENIVQRMGLRGHIEFTGNVENIPGVLTQTDVLVLPSLTEIFPNCVLEAFAAGKPVISTDVGGVSEVVENGENGFLVEPGESASLAETMCRFTKDPGLVGKFGKLGRETVMKNFSIQKNLANLLDLYGGLVASPN